MLTKRLLKVALHATVVLAAATGVAQEPSRPAHLFMEVSLSPDARYVAAVAGAGISNWQSYYGQNGIDEWMVPFFGASVYDDPAVYARSSPINFIRQVRTPTFSYVGAADPSVNFQAQSTAITSTGMNAAKTQNAATLAALNEMPSASPDKLATMPAAAVPTA
jgi:hypothetical protein